ncbi:MAG: type II secretion system protein GspL [Porticoccaceae bacterium]|nr:type II secretion system protein GspL [Porticoccaceae bacterium]MDG1474942.1 type II secretion system protein GspL [Porticoccaceae bacterium]
MKIDHLYHLDQRLNDLVDPLQPPVSENMDDVCVWIPSDRISSHLVDIPSAPERKWPDLLPWMLEDRLLQAAEDMHFVVAGRTSEQLQVIAVSRQDMSEWIRIAENAGVSAVAMAPDYLALPWEEGILSIGWREGSLLVRQSESVGFAASPDVGWALVDSILSSSDVPLRLSVSIPEADLVPAHLSNTADINRSVVDWKFAPFPVINLMTADFKPKQKASWLSYWWSVAASMVLMVGCLIGYIYSANQAIEGEVVILEQQLVGHYSSLFNGPKPQSDNVRSRVESSIDDLFEQQKSLQSLPIAGLIQLDSIMKGCECELISLSADQNMLKITVANGAKLSSKTLSIPGYQISLKSGQEPDTLVLTLAAVRRPS